MEVEAEGDVEVGVEMGSEGVVWWAFSLLEQDKF